MALEAASHWPIVQGKTSAGGVGVVEMRVPNSTLRTLGPMVRKSFPAGVRGFPEQTVFLPNALDILNGSAVFKLRAPSF
jgi:hypothetical protein